MVNESREHVFPVLRERGAARHHYIEGAILCSIVYVPLDQLQHLLLGFAKRAPLGHKIRAQAGSYVTTILAATDIGAQMERTIPRLGSLGCGHLTNIRALSA